MRLKLLLILIFLSLPLKSFALYDPLTRPNNQYGIHVADLTDLSGVASLVNSEGGDWGYVTLVIPESDRNSKKWQEVFDDLRKLRLIPIVRLAGVPQNSHWKIPDKNSLRDWINFLNSLNWPVENRYVVLFNEPNHAKEWGGTLAPEDYAEIATTLIQELKSASPDFFVMLAGFDVSAQSDLSSMDAEIYLKRVFAAKPELKELIDGWSSHSYPNPGFSGSPFAWGRGTLRSYQWELSLLRELGVSKTLPVFITENGWKHCEGKFRAFNALSAEKISEYLTVANQNIWQDSQIAAVTPFIYNYQDEPFDHFSWRKIGTDGYYDFAETFRKFPKTAGEPRQHETYELTSPIIPETLVVNSAYSLTAQIKNLGQGILWSDNKYELSLTSSPSGISILVPLQTKLEPNHKGELTINLQTPAAAGRYHFKLILRHFDQTTTLEEHDVELLPPPALEIKAQLAWKKTSEATDAAVLVYDDKEVLLHKFTGLVLKNGVMEVPGLTQVIPGQIYRIVLIVPNYLPRQTHVKITLPETRVLFRRFLPLDFNNDGKFSLGDLVVMLSRAPKDIVKLFSGP